MTCPSTALPWCCPLGWSGAAAGEGHPRRIFYTTLKRSGKAASTISTLGSTWQCSNDPSLWVSACFQNCLSWPLARYPWLLSGETKLAKRVVIGNNYHGGKREKEGILRIGIWLDIRSRQKIMVQKNWIRYPDIQAETLAVVDTNSI